MGGADAVCARVALDGLAEVGHSALPIVLSEADLALSLELFRVEESGPKCALDDGSLIGMMSFAEPEYFRAELAERFERALVTRVDLHHLEQMLPRAFSLILHIKGHFLQLVHLSSISFRPRGCLRVQTVHAHDDLARSNHGHLRVRAAEVGVEHEFLRLRA